MAEVKQQETENSGENTNVFHLFDPPRPVRHHEKPASEEELADYRKYWPLMKQMLKEFEILKASGGCPVARAKLIDDQQP